MLKQLITTRTGNTVAVWIMVILGLILTISIEDDKTGTTVFLITTVIEAWVFVIVYGLWSRWRAADVARALFWLGLTYALLSTHITLSAVFRWPAVGYNTNVRQLFYLALAAAMFNMLLVVRRMQWETLEEVRALVRQSYESDMDPADTDAYRLGHEDGLREQN